MLQPIPVPNYAVLVDDVKEAAVENNGCLIELTKKLYQRKMLPSDFPIHQSEETILSSLKKLTSREIVRIFNDCLAPTDANCFTELVRQFQAWVCRKPFEKVGLDELDSLAQFLKDVDKSGEGCELRATSKAMGAAIRANKVSILSLLLTHKGSRHDPALIPYLAEHGYNEGWCQNVSHLAAGCGNLEILQFLFDRGICNYPNREDAFGFNVLDRALGAADNEDGLKVDKETRLKIARFLKAKGGISTLGDSSHYGCKGFQKHHRQMSLTSLDSQALIKEWLDSGIRWIAEANEAS